MVTAEEALQSQDPKTVKRLRGSINTQIQCDVNLLEKELQKKQNGNFDLSKISPQLIKIQKKKLLSHFELIQKLHDRFVAIREEGETEDAEAALVQDDMNYMLNITVLVCPILDGVDAYEEALTQFSKIKNMSKDCDSLRQAVEKSNSNFDLVYNKIKTELDKIDAIEATCSESKLEAVKALPVGTFMSNITAVFNEVKRSHVKLNDTLDTIDKDNTEGKSRLSYDDRYALFLDVEMRLRDMSI